MTPDQQKLRDLLEERVAFYNQPAFIEGDPVCIPHRYNKLQDIEISGFWTAMLSWGQRKTIINKASELFDAMDNAPHDFVLNYSKTDARRLMQFRHRTFQPTDTLFFLEFFRRYYSDHQSLETAFRGDDRIRYSQKDALTRFHDLMFDTEWAPDRTRKHVSTPRKGASCKRLNMFLRWMVRRDEGGVDFGLWRSIEPSDLMIPLDVHVRRVAVRLGLLTRDKSDWRAVEELTATLREMDPRDPAKYDFALFSMGVLEKDKWL